MTNPNVLWIVLDTARADALEPYGAPAGASATLADLASRGHAVPDARATAPWTLPSHASMFTGALARGLGLGQAPATTPQSARPVVQAQGERMISEVLRRRGYSTRAVSANLWVSPMSGFDTGFDEFVQLETSRQARLDGGRREGAKWMLEALWGRADDGAAQAGEVLSRWLAESPPQPFFWFVNVVECHSPYLPPRPFHAVGALERIRAAEEARRHLNLKAIWRACVGEFDIPEDVLERMRRLYAGSVRYVDTWLGDVVSELDGAGILDETLVVVCSDHGENLGEGGLITHAFSLDERLIHVPLVVMGPGADAFAGLRSLAELPARTARAVDLEQHPWTGDELPAGLAVAQWDPPAPAFDPRVQSLVAEWGLGEDTAERFATPLSAAIDGELKLVRRGDREELFDLASDPLERSPLELPGAGTNGLGDRVAVLRAALDHPATRATAGSPSRAAAADEVKEIEEQMRLLGYM